MARRNESLVIDLFETVARVPWWAGLILALLSYVVLGYFAAIELDKVAQLAGAGMYVVKNVAIMLAKVAQILVPIVCVVGAIFSFFRRKKPC